MGHLLCWWRGGAGCADPAAIIAALAGAADYGAGVDRQGWISLRDFAVSGGQSKTDLRRKSLPIARFGLPL
jgi:hypothetical protein